MKRWNVEVNRARSAAVFCASSCSRSAFRSTSKGTIESLQNTT